MKLVPPVMHVLILVLHVRERPHLANPVQQQQIEFLLLIARAHLDIMKLALNVPLVLILVLHVPNRQVIVALVLVRLLEDLYLIVIVKTATMMMVAVKFVHHVATHVKIVLGQLPPVLNV